MAKQKPLVDQIEKFLDIWDRDAMVSFLREITELVELYDVDEDNDWVKDYAGEDDKNNVRLIRTVYLMSRIAEFHAGKLASVRAHCKNIYKKLDKFKRPRDGKGIQD